MHVAISELKAKMTNILIEKGHSQADIPFIINMYLGGELGGQSSHGLTSFPGFINSKISELERPEVIRETHSLYMIDAKGISGNIVGRQAADQAIRRAKREGMAVSVIKNMDNWLRPGGVAEYIADQDFVAIVVNNGRGAAVAPPGGYDPVTGTNPIAYGIPTDDGALVVDMATAKRAWGQVRLANKYGTELPADTFYDDRGNVTVDANQAWSVMPFGDYKGFSLAFLIEVLCGSLVGMPMMVQSTAKNSYGGEHPTTNATMIVFDPAQTAELAEFKQANSEFVNKIKATRARGGETIRVPGERSAKEKSTKIHKDAIDVPDSLWQEILGLR